MNMSAANIEWAYKNLPSADQRLLVCLAPFTSAAHPTVLYAFFLKLRNQPALADFPLDRWKGTIAVARAKGLLNPHPAEPGYFSISSPWTAILRQRPEYALQAPTRDAIEIAFRRVYHEYADAVQKLLDSAIPDQRQLGCDVAHIEYDNLVAAMELGLNHHTSMVRYFAALVCYLKATGRHERALELSERVRRRLEEAPHLDPAGGNRAEFASVLSTIAECEHWLRRYDVAEAHYLQAIEVFSEPQEQQANRAAIAMTHHNLGLLAYDQGKWAEAGKQLDKALAFQQLGSDQAALARTYHQLGRVRARQQDNQRAEECYRQADGIYGTLGNRLAQAAVLVDWATLDRVRGRYKEAKGHYQNALAVCNEFGDRHQAGVVHYNLGVIEELNGWWKKAWNHYRKARRLCFEIGDRRSETASCLRLATLAGQREQPQLAIRYLRRALELSRAEKDVPIQVQVLHALGNAERDRRHGRRAENYYEQAMILLADLDDPVPLCRWTGGLPSTARGAGKSPSPIFSTPWPFSSAVTTDEAGNVRCEAWLGFGRGAGIPRSCKRQRQRSRQRSKKSKQSSTRSSGESSAIRMRVACSRRMQIMSTDIASQWSRELLNGPHPNDVITKAPEIVQDAFPRRLALLIGQAASASLRATQGRQ